MKYKAKVIRALDDETLQKELDEFLEEKYDFRDFVIVKMTQSPFQYLFSPNREVAGKLRSTVIQATMLTLIYTE